jgi:ligand-binding SRPBCC domain-containing protein
LLPFKEVLLRAGEKSEKVWRFYEKRPNLPEVTRVVKAVADLGEHVLPHPPFFKELVDPPD